MSLSQDCSSSTVSHNNFFITINRICFGSQWESTLLKKSVNAVKAANVVNTEDKQFRRGISKPCQKG